VVLLVGEAMATVGAAVSGAVYVTVKVSLVILPAVSDAVTVMVFVPDSSEIPDTDHDVVPVAVSLVDELLETIDHVTVDTSTLSLAVPDIVIRPEVVE